MASPNRVAQLVGFSCPTRTAVGGFSTSSPGGPSGSGTMSFFVVATARRVSANAGYLIARYSGSTTGWAIYYQTTNIWVLGCNSTPALNQTSTPYSVGVPLVIFGQYTNGVIRLYLNGVLMNMASLGAGYTAAAAATTVGRLASAVHNSNDFIIHEAGMLDTFDVGPTAAAVSAQWMQDLEQGRYLTCPTNGGVWGANQAYWSSRDITLGSAGCGSTWLDRSTNLYSMARSGSPQTACVPARFA